MNQTSINFEKIARFATLENTRMLYDFMQALSDRIEEIKKNSDDKREYSGYIGKGGLKKRGELYSKLNQLLTNILENCFETGSENIDYLKQNPLSTYLRFYNDFFGLTNDDFSLITCCLQYFNTLRYLAGKDDTDDLPYLYEDLCLSMREMTGCYAAYILYGKGDETAKLVSRSGYVVPKEEKEEGKLEPLRFTYELWDRLICRIRKLMSKSKENNDDYSFEIVDGVYKIRYIDSGNGYDYLAIVLPLDEKTKDEKPYIYIILDYFNPEPKHGAHSTEDILEINKNYVNAVCKILFMRYRLLSCLKRDYAVLMNFRYDCGYIKSVDSVDSVDKNKASSKILHISDLHLSEDNIEILMNGIRCIPGFPKNDDRIDFLAITGDIIEASSNASEAQKKYKMAANLIRELAKRLWGYSKNGDNVCILPHDWKRRVLIVPGNHDYTTMSDVVVETASRKIKAAFPANESAGTMSKLTYYIEFLADCLDIPIVELVMNDMNEVRDYKKLKLKVGLFNTVAQSNSLQNNKVGFTQKEKLVDLLERKKWLAGDQGSRSIVLSHHSLDYKINYFDDRYKFYNFDKYEIVPPNCDKTTLETVLRDVWNAISEEIVKQNSIMSFGEFCDKLEVSSYAERGTKKQGVIHYLAKELPDSISDKEHDKFIKTELRNDLQRLDRILEKCKKYNAQGVRREGEPFSEFDLAFMAQCWSIAKAQAEDQKSFDDIWINHIRKDNLMCLSGHEHKLSEGKNFRVEDQLYNSEHGHYNWSVHHIPHQNNISSGHYGGVYIDDLWIEYKKSDKLCEISKFLANKNRSPDEVSGFFCNFLKKVKDEGFQKICAKWSDDLDHEGLFINYLNKAEFNKALSSRPIDGLKIYENSSGLRIDLKNSNL